MSGEDARREAALLLQHVLHVSDAWLVAHSDDPVDASDAAAFHALIEDRARGRPIAYLTGRQAFHEIELHVTADVLIPRPETELLVDLALQRIPINANWTVADLGTGSGAVALAVARARPRSRVTATDASAAALAVARTNAGRLGLPNVRFVAGDWCAALGDDRFDIILSNPPYVAEGDLHLLQGDLRFEPRVALAAGPDGLAAIRVIAGEARAHLGRGGWLFLEHGFDQGARTRALLAAHEYTGVSTERDLEGRERVSVGHV